MFFFSQKAINPPRAGVLNLVFKGLKNVTDHTASCRPHAQHNVGLTEAVAIFVWASIHVMMLTFDKTISQHISPDANPLLGHTQRSIQQVHAFFPLVHYVEDG